jgi:hypothetical protein
VTGERHAALERSQRLIERHIAALEPFHQALEFDQCLLKIDGFAVA